MYPRLLLPVHFAPQIFPGIPFVKSTAKFFVNMVAAYGYQERVEGIGVNFRSSFPDFGKNVRGNLPADLFRLQKGQGKTVNAGMVLVVYAHIGVNIPLSEGQQYVFGGNSFLRIFHA